VISYRHVLVGAALYDPFSGLAIFPLPKQAARIPTGTTHAILAASDYQEGKNIASTGTNLLPNTRFKRVTIHGVGGPAITWLAPLANQCVRRRQAVGLAVEASSNSPIVSVRFSVDGKELRVLHRGAAGLFATTWHVGAAKPGRHLLGAIATDEHGKRLAATRGVRVCKP
jgi:hypothetical protein